MNQTLKFSFRNLFLSCVCLLLFACGGNPEIISPDGRTRLSFVTGADGCMAYTVERDGKPLILPSALGLVVQERNLAGGFSVREIVKRSVDETWTQPWGENKILRDCHNEMTAVLKNDDGVLLTLRFRAFDDGVAFRYEWEVPDLDSLTVTDELTEFRFAEDGVSWSIPGNFNTYELLYRELPVSAVENANTPFTFRVDGTYGSIHEAALYDFPEMNLYRTDSLAFKAELAPLPDGIKARIPSKFMTAWRTIQVGDKAVDLINSSLILNLNEPSKIADTSWIKPQKYIGVWWGLHLGTHTWTMGPRHGATTENALRHIDFAAANNIQGVLFEGWNEGWENWGQCPDQEFHLFNCKYSISGTIQHKTVSFKADMLLILKFILFHMMYGIIKCPVIMRYFPTDDMNLVFSFIDQYFWSVLKFNKQFYVLVETVIFSQQYFSTFFNSIIFFLIR